MKRRVIIASLLLAGGFLLSLSFSDAPPRVHLVHLLTWYPPLLGAAAILWSRSLQLRYKALAIMVLFGLAGWISLWASVLTVKKIELSLYYYGAGIIGWVVALPILVALTWLVDRLVPSAGPAPPNSAETKGAEGL